MKLNGRWKYLPIVLILAVGISGVFEALPHASESVNDLLIDAGILALIIVGSILAARLLQARRTSKARNAP